MSTKEQLYLQYANAPVIPVAKVCRDYFEMTPEIFMRKISAGEIRLPIVRMYDDSKRAAKAIRVDDLADYLDKRIDKAVKEYNALYN